MSIIFNLRSDFSCIQCTGTNTQSFLQGQITCDMNQLKKSGDYSLAACCDHKGRMVANFWVIRRDSDFLILLPKDMQTILMTHLKKYAPFSKVSLAAYDTQLIYSAQCDSFTMLNSELDSTAMIITLPNPNRHLILTHKPLSITHNHDSWVADNIQDKLAILTPQTSLLFTPQMIALEKQGGVSFNKGCYVGQEIVARTHYLGKLKRHLQHLQIETNHCPQSGESLSNDQNRPIGVVVTARQSSEYMADVLAVVQDNS